MNKTWLQSAPLPSAIEYATEYGTFQDVAWVDCDAVDFAVNFAVDFVVDLAKDFAVYEAGDFAVNFAVDFANVFRPELQRLLQCRKPSSVRGVYPTHPEDECRTRVLVFYSSSGNSHHADLCLPVSCAAT